MLQKKNGNAALARLARKIFIITSLALVALLCHRFLPERQLRLLPDETEVYSLFHDGMNGGLTQAEWIDRKAFHFVCHAHEGGIEWPYCGLEVEVGQGSHGRDLSWFDELKVKLDYTGPANQLRVFLRHFDRRYSQPGIQETLKSAEAVIPTRNFHEEVLIRPFEWHVPSYWLLDNNAPRSRAFADFRNVVSFGVDILPRFPPGRHELKVEYIQLRGAWIQRADWYLTVAVVWLVTILILMGYQMIVLNRRVLLDSDRLFNLATYTDALKSESEKYQELSSIDELTGTLNRAGLAYYLDERFPGGRFRQDVSLLIIDLDHFKRINDTHGHDVGDQVLRTLSRRIAENLRAADRLVRWGGEEFVLICPDTAPAEALLVAEKLRGIIARERFPLTTGDLHVTASIGAGTSHSGEGFEHLFKRVDRALYSAKELGRNCVVTAKKEAAAAAPATTID